MCPRHVVLALQEHLRLNLSVAHLPPLQSAFCLTVPLQPGAVFETVKSEMRFASLVFHLEISNVKCLEMKIREGSTAPPFAADGDFEAQISMFKWTEGLPAKTKNSFPSSLGASLHRIGVTRRNVLNVAKHRILSHHPRFLSESCRRKQIHTNLMQLARLASNFLREL